MVLANWSLNHLVVLKDGVGALKPHLFVELSYEDLRFRINHLITIVHIGLTIVVVFVQLLEVDSRGIPSLRAYIKYVKFIPSGII